MDKKTSQPKKKDAKAREPMGEERGSASHGLVPKATEHKGAPGHSAHTGHPEEKKSCAHAKETRGQPQEHSHLPLHEQIKRQLSGKISEPKKEKEELHKTKATAEIKLEKPKEAKALVKEKTEEKGTARETPAPKPVSAPAPQIQAKKAEMREPGLALTYFETAMMTKIEIKENGTEIALKITGNFGLDKNISVGKAKLAEFLRGALPKKINSMGAGDGFEIVGMDMDELEEFFKASIPVEPKGEIEVSEKDDGRKVSINIRIAGTGEPLFNYSAPGMEDVRRLVEREKLAIMSSSKLSLSPVNKELAQKEEGNPSDWLQEQIKQQGKDVAALAKELGEKVSQNLPKEEAPAVDARAPAIIPSQTVSPPEQAAEAQAPKALETAQAPSPPTAQAASSPTQAPADAASGDAINMAEFMDAYKEEAVTYVDALKKLPQLKDNPQNADLISEIHRSAHSLKSMSAAMGFLNISKVSKALELLFANYKKGGVFDMGNYDAALGAVEKINTLYSDLANSEKADVEEVVKKVESVTPP